ncbi:hypothetical protein [Aeromonas phage Akh-2]|nr:hypothetical protein [Aeromonas phage Akh-2]
MKNFVAKHAHKFNRCATFSDRTKYSRKGFMVDWDEDEPPVRANLYRR